VKERMAQPMGCAFTALFAKMKVKEK